MSIELRLECIGQSSSNIQFRLAITSHEPHRILIPYPEITGLQFTDARGIGAQWYTCLLVSASWSGLVLDPGESKVATFSVRPASVPRPRRDDDLDYYRWSVDITAGRYDVRYSMRVDADYFDGDSHYRFPQIEREAQELSARAWTGRAESNAVTIEHTEPTAPPNAPSASAS
jgi:hypothetical protein